MYRLEQIGCRPKLRMREGEPFATDNGNYLLDCLLGSIERPEELHTELKRITGVVETGLFLSMADKVIIGTDTGVEVLDRTRV
jgi:ribose 5-phosphate isomerase A